MERRVGHADRRLDRTGPQNNATIRLFNVASGPGTSRDSNSALAARAPIGLPFHLPEAGWGIGGLLCEGEQARQLHAGQGLNGQAGQAAQARQAWPCYAAALLELQRQTGRDDE
jgi:hypothetical protein